MRTPRPSPGWCEDSRFGAREAWACPSLAIWGDPHPPSTSVCSWGDLGEGPEGALCPCHAEAAPEPGFRPGNAACASAGRLVWEPLAQEEGFFLREKMSEAASSPRARRRLECPSAQGKPLGPSVDPSCLLIRQNSGGHRERKDDVCVCRRSQRRRLGTRGLRQVTFRPVLFFILPETFTVENLPAFSSISHNATCRLFPVFQIMNSYARCHYLCGTEVVPVTGFTACWHFHMQC